VLRLRAGAAVRVFDGDGHEFEAEVDRVSRQGVDLRLFGPVAPRPESPLEIVLAVSPLKGDRMEEVIQKATELGVSAIRPVILARTDAVARPALKGSRQERWDKVASGAAEQCGRATVPRIAATEALDAFLGAPFEGTRIVVRPGAPALGGPLQGPVLVLVGPAGGFEPHELERLAGAGFLERGLGPRILRAETAAVVVVAVLQVLFGDLA
jgi:16S rRNA (uracil1498-N3)-methyltransferase